MSLPSPLRPLLAVALGAIPGALGRYYLGLALPLPLGTLAANLLGCGAMGLVTGLAAWRWSLSPDLQRLVATGFLGSFTTFATYELDLVVLLEHPGWWSDGLYWVGSPVLGLGCFYAGQTLGRRWVRLHPDP